MPDDDGSLVRMELAPGDREVLLLVTWEGLTPAEVAVVLGIPAGTVRSGTRTAR